jgi:hypothetical protein
MSNFDKNVEKYERAVDKVANTAEKVAGVANRAQIGCWMIFMNLFFAGFCLWGVYAAYIGWQLQSRGHTTTGTVIRMEESNTSEGGCCVYSPVIEFDVSGQTFSFEGGNASNPPDYQVGDIVNVRYDPADPNTAQIDSYFERWALPICLIPAMIIATLVTNLFMIRAWRRNEYIGGS